MNRLCLFAFLFSLFVGSYGELCSTCLMEPSFFGRSLTQQLPNKIDDGQIVTGLIEGTSFFIILSIMNRKLVATFYFFAQQEEEKRKKLKTPQ